MPEKNLILHIPVIHKGYLDLLGKLKGAISNVYIINGQLQDELSDIKPDIASLSPETVKELLDKIGFQDVLILSKDNIGELADANKELILIQDELSRNLYDKYLKGKKVEWQSVFLRWDKEKVLAELPVGDIEKSEDSFDLKMMKEAYKEAEKSSDWWRQIGAVLVRDGEIVARSYNQGVPNDNSPYQLGSIRDLFKAGEKQEFSPTIHAEQRLIAEAARAGLRTEDAFLYLTHFPCPVCSKLIAWSGIKKLYFSEGAANLDGRRILELADIKIVHISQK